VPLHLEPLARCADELLSLRECDGYFISVQQLALMGSIDDPTGAHSRDATCFAGVATDEDLAGVPPHVNSVNELDPLRDGTGLLPKTAARGRARNGADGGGHLPRRRATLARRDARGLRGEHA
jgi:hypothetical protein